MQCAGVERHLLWAFLPTDRSNNRRCRRRRPPIPTEKVLSESGGKQFSPNATRRRRQRARVAKLGNGGGLKIRSCRGPRVQIPSLASPGQPPRDAGRRSRSALPSQNFDTALDSSADIDPLLDLPARGLPTEREPCQPQDRQRLERVGLLSDLLGDEAGVADQFLDLLVACERRDQ